MARGETDRAIISLKVAKEGEKAEPVDVSSELLSLSFEDDEKKPGKLTLVFDNYTLRFLDEDTFKSGNTLIAEWGYSGWTKGGEFIIGRISAGPSTITIEAIHKGSLLSKNKKSRAFENMTRAEVVQKIAKEWGYENTDVDVQDTKTKYAIIHQHGVTDGEFLKRLADREGFVFSIDSSGFHFHERKLDQAPGKSVTWFTDEVGALIDWSYESEKKKRKGRVKTEGRDPISKKSFAVDSKNDTVPRASLGSILESVDRKAGELSLQTHTADDDLRGASEASAAAAKASSDAAFKKHQHGTHKLTLTLYGDPDLKAQTVIEVNGIGKRLSGLWYAKKARDDIDDKGQYLVKLECVRDGHNGHKNSPKDVKTAGDVNSKAVKEGLREVENIHKVTGESSIVWKK